MKEIYLEKKEGIELNLDKEKIKFILLLGNSISEKNTFFLDIASNLINKNSPDKIGFIIFNIKDNDFHNRKSNYLINPIIDNTKEVIDYLDDIARIETRKKIFIYMEDDDISQEYRAKLGDVIGKLIKNKSFCIIYSTDKNEKEYLNKWMINFVDLKIIF